MENLLLDTVGGLMKGDTLSMLTNLIGADSEGATKKGILASASALMTSLAQQSATADGANAVQQTIASIDPNLLNNVTSYLQNPGAMNVTGMLQQIMGPNMGPMIDKIAKASGLNTSSIGTLLSALTPIVLGTAGKAIESQGLGVQDLPKFFSDQAGYMKTLTPGLMGFLERIDANDDGSILDDLSRLTSRIFG